MRVVSTGTVMMTGAVGRSKAVIMTVEVTVVCVVSTETLTMTGSRWAFKGSYDDYVVVCICDLKKS